MSARLDSVKLHFSNGATALLDYEGDIVFTTPQGSFWGHAMVEEVEANAFTIVEYNAAAEAVEGKSK